MKNDKKISHRINCSALFIVGLMFILTINLASSLELNPFADKKIFDKNGATDVSDYLKQDLNPDYGVIKLSKTFLWIETDKIAEYSLTKNTEYCIDDCYQIIKTTLYKDMSLYDNIDQKILAGDNKELNLQMYLLTAETYYTDIPDTYTEECITDKNSSKYCYNKVATWKQESHTREVWTEYKGEILKAGDYTYKITGKINAGQKVDIVQTSNGIEFTEWAAWTAADCKGVGGTITIAGDLCVHTFNQSGTFNITSNITNASILTVAGGGGGGGGTAGNGGGGGAGGLIYNSSINLSISNLTLTVGIGGVGGNGDYGTNGGNSAFGSISGTVVGGGGGSYYGTGHNGKAGGSGGGGSQAYSSVGGAGTAGQGNDGGSMSTSNSGSGGGGKGLIGGNATDGSSTAGVGGNGTAYNVTGVLTYFAGGGGGGSHSGAGAEYAIGGLGGGGNGCSGNKATPAGLGVNGTGGGGGACGESVTGARGGDGVIIVSYSLGSASATATLVSPADGYISPINSIDFNCSGSVSGATLTNMSWYKNGVLNETKIITGTTNQTMFTKSLPEGNTNWTCRVCDSDSSCSFASANRTVSVDTTKPSITILYPTGTISYGYLGQNVSLNYTITDTNIDKCWFEYQGINTTIPCASNYTILLNTSKSLNIWANDTLGNINYTTKSWDYSVWENGVTYSNPVVEGELTTINSSFTLNGSISSITLNYNGTIYVPSISVSGSDYQIIANVSAPTVNSNQNISFYYMFTIGGNTINSSTKTQTITNVGVNTSCGAGTYPLLNIFNYDEASLVAINGTVEYNLGLLNNGVEIAATNGTATGVNISLCSSQNLSNSLATFSLEMRYYKNDSTTFYETYNIEDSPGATAPLSINLYYLNNSQGTQFKINYLDFYYLTHPGAIIQIQRQYLSENLYRIVEIPKIADSGQAIGSFSTNNIRYKLIVIENGIVLDTFNDVFPICQSIILGTCELNLRGAKTTGTSTLDDFTYTLTKTNSTIILTYVIPSGTPKSINLITTQNSRFLGNISNCNSTLFASGGTITCGYNNTVGDSIINLEILTNNANAIYGNVLISEDLSPFFLLNNYFIGFILLLTLFLMFISSAIMMLFAAGFGVIYLGAVFLLRGADLVTIASSTIWLLIAIVLAIFKISQKEDKT